MINQSSSGWLQSILRGTYVEKLKTVWTSIWQFFPSINTSVKARDEDRDGVSEIEPLQTSDWEVSEHDGREEEEAAIHQIIQRELESERVSGETDQRRILDVRSFLKLILEKKVKEAASVIVKALNEGLTPDWIMETIIRFYYDN